MSRPADDKESTWSAAFESALSSGPAATGDLLLFLEERQDVTVELDSGYGVPVAEHSRTCGLAAHGPQVGGRFLYRADPDPQDVEKLVSCLLQRTQEPVPAAPLGPLPGVADSWLPVEWATGLVQELESVTRASHPKAEIRARWVGFEQRILVARPGRGVVSDLRRGSRLRLEVTLPGSWEKSPTVAETVLDPGAPGAADGPVERLVDQACRRAEQRRSAKSLLSGEFPVVFAPGAGGVLIHEVVGHALEADTVLGRASWLAGPDSKPFQGSPEVLVVDDPRRGRAAWRFDDEGEPARATALMQEGRVTGRLHDRSSAARIGCATTGHGRRASFREPARPRMGCTFLAPGRFEAGDALRDLEKGIYVRRMEAASTDTRSGLAVFRVTDADRIHHGRIDRPVTSHLLFVDARQALASVERVSDDLAFDVCIGSCLHHGQPLSSSVGGPTFRVGSTRVRF